MRGFALISVREIWKKKIFKLETRTEESKIGKNLRTVGFVTIELRKRKIVCVLDVFMHASCVVKKLT